MAKNTKHNFIDGNVLRAVHLNEMEDWIDSKQDELTNADKTAIVKAGLLDVKLTASEQTKVQSSIGAASVAALNEKINKPTADDEGKFACAKDGGIEWVEITQSESGGEIEIPDGSITAEKIDPEFLTDIENNYVTPEKYGALGDGAHDDAQALKEALESGKPVMLTRDLYIKTPVSIINHDAYLDGNGYTIYEDFAGDTNYYTGLMFFGSSQPKSDKTVLRVLISNKTYDTADYTGQTNGRTDYKYGYVSYKGKDPIHGSAFLDWELGNDYTEYCYEEHTATVKNLTIKGTHVAGHILLGFSQLCHGLIDNVRVYALDGDCQGGIRIFRCHDVTCRSSWAENCAPMTTYNTAGDAGYGFSIDGDCIQVVNCGGWNNKDELCIGGDRECWSTNVIVDGFTCGCIDDPEQKYGNQYRFADRFNCHAAAVNPTIKNVYCHITNPSGRGIEAFAIRCPEVTLENIHVDTDQQGAVIRFYEIAQKAHFKNLYAPQCIMQISTLNPYMLKNIDIDGGELYRILDADYKTEMRLHNVRILQFIDAVKRIWMTDCTIDCDTGTWMSPVALNVTEEAWLVNCAFSSNRSEYIAASTPVIKAPANSIFATSCKFYKRLNRNTFNTEQTHIVNCGEYNLMEARLDDGLILDEAELA